MASAEPPVAQLSVAGRHRSGPWGCVPARAAGTVLPLGRPRRTAPGGGSTFDIYASDYTAHADAGADHVWARFAGHGDTGRCGLRGQWGVRARRGAGALLFAV